MIIERRTAGPAPFTGIDHGRIGSPRGSSLSGPGPIPRAAGAFAEAVEKLLDLGEEARGFRVGFAGGLLLELGQKLLLTLGQLLRRLHHHLDVHVAGPTRTQDWHCFCVQPQAPFRFRAFRHLHPASAAVDGRDIEAAAERRGDHGDRHPTVQVGALALKERVRSNRQEDVEIARRPAARAGLALAGEPDARAVLDPGRPVGGARALTRVPPRSGARRAGIVDDLAASVAARTGPLQGEEALGMTNFAVATAGRTGLGLRSRLGARAGAGFAGHRGRDANLRGLADKRLFEADLHVVAQVRPALASGRAAARSRHAENALENIREGRAEIGAEAGCAAGAAVLEGGMAETIIGGALVAVLEHVIGLVDLLEAVLGLLVAGVAVRVAFHRELAERGLEFRFAGSAPHAKDFVVIPFGHYRHASLRCGQGGLCISCGTPAPLSGRSALSRERQTNGPARVRTGPLGFRIGLPSRRSPGRRQADFLFFLSSSTSVISASTTSSLVSLLAASGPAPGPAAPAWAWAYIASPSFIEACASALVLARIASASSPLTASRRSAIAFSMAEGSACPTCDPCSASAFSVAWIRASPWFLASTRVLRFLSSSAWLSASLTMRSISASLRPPDAWIRICCSLPVALSLAETLTMQF